MINGCGKNGRGPMLFIKKSRNSQLTFSSVESPKTYQQYLLNMVALLEKLQMIDEGFRNRIIDREKQSTIFGGGIAFPHTINQGYAKTILMFGKLEEPYQKEMIGLNLSF